MSKEARDAVLGRVRRSLGRGRDVSELRRTIAERLSEPRANLIPARANLDRYGRIGLAALVSSAISGPAGAAGSAAAAAAPAAEHSAAAPEPAH